MKPRFLCLVPTAIALFAAGCGDGSSAAPVRSSYDTDPAEYWGRYIGTRMDLDDPAMAESTEQLIGSSILMLDAEDTTFTMNHERIKFGGTCQYLELTDAAGEKYRAMKLIVDQVGGVSRAQIARIDLATNKAAGREPGTPEELEKYMQIFEGIKWYFEVLPDGFRQLDIEGSPGMYEFRRDQFGGAAAASNSVGQTGSGTDGAGGSGSGDSAQGNDSPRRGTANVGR